MKKNVIAILFIFLVPLALYWGLTRDKGLATLPTIAFTGSEIIKFSSPMCYECQELDKVFKEVYPEFANKVSVTNIDVTKNDKEFKKLIKQYDVKLVPTCVFKNKEGQVVRRTEGMIQPRILENYIREQING